MNICVQSLTCKHTRARAHTHTHASTNKNKITKGSSANTSALLVQASHYMTLCNFSLYLASSQGSLGRRHLLPHNTCSSNAFAGLSPQPLLYPVLDRGFLISYHHKRIVSNVPFSRIPCYLILSKVNDILYHGVAVLLELLQEASHPAICIRQPLFVVYPSRLRCCLQLPCRKICTPGKDISTSQSAGTNQNKV